MNEANMELAAARRVEGLTFRSFRGEADFPVMARIQSASNKADGIEETIETEEVANDMAHLAGFDPWADMMFAQVGDETVGFSRMSWRINAEGQRVYWQWGHVLPEWRRRGIGAAFLQFTEARARAHAGAHPHAGPSFLHGVGEDTAIGKNALFARNGYTIVRHFFFMRRPTLTRLPDAPLPEGFELRPARADHLREIWDTKEAAFRDHWGFAEKSEADYARWLNNPINDLSLWQIVWDTAHNRVAGISLNSINEKDNEDYGFKRGWIDTLGVRREYRGRGLARALLVSGMTVLRERGMTEAVLGVDSENLTGALRIYESVGFEVLNRDALYRKAI